MIKISGEYTIPKPLVTTELMARKKHLVGARKLAYLEYARSVVDLEDVRRQIWEKCHGKCAFCERKLPFGPQTTGFYRPPGRYAWLACEWNNLLLLCGRCERARGNRFPLVSESDRVLEPPDSQADWSADSAVLAGEKALLIHPELEDPEPMLAIYPDGRIYAVDGHEGARVTIELMQLNHETLINARAAVVRTIAGRFERAFDGIGHLGMSSHQALVRLAFERPFEYLFERAKSTGEYAFVARYIQRNLLHFFAEHYTDQQKEILRIAYELFMGDDREADRELPRSRALLPIRLEQLAIHNVKCFKEVSIRFGRRTILILGPNGRGKSTILQLLALGFSGMPKPVSTNGWLAVGHAAREEAAFEIELAIDQKRERLTFEIDAQDEVHLIKGLAACREIRDKTLIAAYGVRRNLCSEDKINGWRFEAVASLFDNNGYLKNIRNSNVYHKVERGFDQIKPLINRIFILADPRYRIELANFDTESFYFQTPTDHSGWTPLEALSDGYRSTFVWLFDMIMRAWEKNADLTAPSDIHGLVMIDELDLHLHPTWQRNLLPVLEDMFPNIQFIVTTHSPFIVQSMRPDNLVLSIKDYGEVQVIDGAATGTTRHIDEIVARLSGSNVPHGMDLLQSMLSDFQLALEAGDRNLALHHYLRLSETLPEHSNFRGYLDTMLAGLPGEYKPLTP